MHWTSGAARAADMVSRFKMFAVAVWVAAVAAAGAAAAVLTAASGMSQQATCSSSIRLWSSTCSLRVMLGGCSMSNAVEPLGAMTPAKAACTRLICCDPLHMHDAVCYAGALTEGGSSQPCSAAVKPCFRTEGPTPTPSCVAAAAYAMCCLPACSCCVLLCVPPGAREAAFRNVKTISECLADELMNAAKGSSNRCAGGTGGVVRGRPVHGVCVCVWQEEGAVGSAEVHASSFRCRWCEWDC